MNFTRLSVNGNTCHELVNINQGVHRVHLRWLESCIVLIVSVKNWWNRIANSQNKFNTLVRLFVFGAGCDHEVSGNNLCIPSPIKPEKARQKTGEPPKICNHKRLVACVAGPRGWHLKKYLKLYELSPATNIAPENGWLNGWNTSFLLGPELFFRGYVSFIGRVNITWQLMVQKSGDHHLECRRK